MLAGSIPEQIGQLQQLKALLLSSNQLTGAGEGWLIDTMINLFMLPACLPDSIAQLIDIFIFFRWKFHVLLLAWHGEAGTIPEFIGELQNLQTLSVANNSLSGPPPPSPLYCPPFVGTS